MNSMIRIILLLAICSTHSAHERFWYPYHDGTSRVVRLTADTLQSTLQNKNIVIVHFELANEQNEKGKNDAVNRMLETTAQVLENNQVVVGVYNLADGAPSAEEGLQQPGAIKVYKQGKPFDFNGYHLPETLLSFISKVNSSAVTQIANKQDKKLFDNYEGTKVIGFFQQESGAYKFYEQAAEFFHPNVPFFVVFDQLIANSLRCKGTGIIEVAHPFRKDRVQCPQIPATTDEIVNFVKENRGGSSLLKITKENVHSLWGERENNVVAFYSSASPAGRSFFKVLKGRARYCNATTNPMLAIDTDQFPMLIDVWQSLLKIDLSQPYLGYVNSKTYAATWMDISPLSTMTPVDQTRAIQQWMQDVEDGFVRNDGAEPAPATEAKKPLACQEKVEKVKKNEKETRKEEKVEEVKNAQVEETATKPEAKVKEPEPEVKRVPKPKKKQVEPEKKEEKSQAEEKKQVEKKNEKKPIEKVKKPKTEAKDNNQQKEEKKKKVDNKREEKEKKPRKENKEEQNGKKVEREKKPRKENKEEQNEKKVEKEKFNKNKKHNKKNEESKNERKNERKNENEERNDKRQNKEKKYKNEKQQKSKKNKK